MSQTKAELVNGLSVNAAAADAVTINSSGNVGIGTTSPDLPLHVEGTSNADEKKLFRLTNGGGSAGTTAVMEFECGVDEIATISANNAGGDIGNLMFGTATSQNAYPTEKMRIDSSGKVGIGKTSPDQQLHVYHATDNGLLHLESGDSQARIKLKDNAGETHLGAIGNNTVFWQTSSLNESMRINSSGDLLVGTTSVDPGITYNNYGTMIDNAGYIAVSKNGGTSIYANRDNTTGTIVSFRYNGTERGKVQTDGSTISYATSSDYRLKENVVSISDGITRVKTLKPSRFNFKENASKTVDGFLAHEVSSIVPEAISGTKDEVDSDNNPIYQGIDQAKLVPLLTAALQEEISKREALEARVATLEAA